VTAGTTPLRAGDRGWLLDVDSTQISTAVAAITAQPWAPLVQDLIPAAQSILVLAHSTADMALIGDRLTKLELSPRDSVPDPVGRTVVIAVRYDGPDLAAVARARDLSADGVIAAHTAARHRVGFFGFAPGFAYLEGLPAQLRMPRLPTPRTRVPAGVVAVAGPYTCVYPGGTPGGWHLIGTTSEVLWDTNAAPPNRLQLGDRVIFEAVP
jgi:KipI family sensor histidine kinase inhibitor